MTNQTNDQSLVNELLKSKKESPHRASVPHIYSSKPSRTENLNEPEASEKEPKITSTTKGNKYIALSDG